MKLYNKVEDYHAIIEEPMDFGTVRAKLHDKMYKTLEQFEVNNLFLYMFLCLFFYFKITSSLTHTHK